ncbi:MAG TPA: hypothetical protein VLI21_12150 [Casimicrobiaceae bacterium]|nr:hypothetical protein [Casimicrobiaceae bacterium]
MRLDSFTMARSRIVRFSFMPARLEPLRAAFGALPDDVLYMLRDIALQVGHVAPSFTAWIKHATVWELDRRAGVHYYLLFPEELANPDEFVRGAERALAEIRRALGGRCSDCSLTSLSDALGRLVRWAERYK